MGKGMRLRHMARADRKPPYIQSHKRCEDLEVKSGKGNIVELPELGSGLGLGLW